MYSQLTDNKMTSVVVFELVLVRGLIKIRTLCSSILLQRFIFAMSITFSRQ